MTQDRYSAMITIIIIPLDLASHLPSIVEYSSISSGVAPDTRKQICM